MMISGMQILHGLISEAKIMKRSGLLKSFAIAIVSSLIISCGAGSAPPVQVSVYGPPGKGQSLSGATIIRVSLSGPDIPTEIKSSAFLLNSEIKIPMPEISFGDNRQIEVMLCKTDCNPVTQGEVIAKGYSAPFSVHAGDDNLDIFVYVTLIDKFSPTAVSYQSQGVKASHPKANTLMGSRSVVLQDGRVLITGGATVKGTTYAEVLKPENVMQVFNTAIIYDPNSNIFTTLTNGMNMPRAYHTMTLLSDGRVFICGGFTGTTNGPGVTKLCEIFNPDTNEFDMPKDGKGKVLTQMAWARAMHTATLVGDTNGLGVQNVLFAGGVKGSGNGGLNNWEIYNVKAHGDVAYGTSLSTARWNHTAVLLNNYAVSLGTPKKVVLLIGGENSSDVLKTVDVIDLQCNLSGDDSKRADKTGACVNPGVGGTASNGPITIPGPGRTLASTVYEPSRRLFYLIGGFTKKDYSTATDRIDVFYEYKGVFSASLSAGNYLTLSNPRAAGSAVLQFENGLNAVLVSGGVLFPKSGKTGPTATAEVIMEVPQQGSIHLQVTTVGDDMGTAMVGNQAVMLNTGRAMIFGGLSGNLAPNTDAYLYTFQ